MVTLPNSTVALLERCLMRRQEQEFGFRFQGAVAVALGQLSEFQRCYSNDGAGQPDIIATNAGFEVKSTSSDDGVTLDGNYRAIRGQYPNFWLVGLRTDVKPYPLWVIRLPDHPPVRIRFDRVLTGGLQSDLDLEGQLCKELSILLTAAGTSWSDEPDRARAKARLETIRDTLGPH